ncbi:Crp/Fnr family transcriptional regulator [Mucilaginibacter gynuensis]|uniref:Crp/Fnr family transcriptional regulator n=1 Tax=Mucilaginibacter gynuensis TaxID=1302236 RepID=A0ABP8G2C1_9SPHI
MEYIRKYLDGIVVQSDDDWAYFSSRLSKAVFPKKTIILQSGQTENYLSFIEQGIIRYFIPGIDKEVTFGFSFENEFESCYDSLLTQSRSVYSTETLTDTILWRISYADLQAIYANTHAGNTIGRLAAEDLFVKKAKRELSLLNEHAAQRYNKLFTERPHLIKQIPLKYIASYIGITPQALSRIRKAIS